MLSSVPAAPTQVKEGVEVRKCTGGWSGTWKSRTTRPYTIAVNGRVVRTAAGAIRTFATREAAVKVAETL